jgi:bacterioferritin-associated ferredoxin
MRSSIVKGDRVMALDTHGGELAEVEVMRVVTGKKLNRTFLVRVRAPKDIAPKIAGIRIQESHVTEPMQAYVSRLTDDTIICRCERVAVAEVRELIRQGVRDINEIKTITRAGMGACGAKTCSTLIKYLFRQEGIPQRDVTDNVARPLFMEVPLGVFCGMGDGEDDPENSPEGNHAD